MSLSKSTGHNTNSARRIIFGGAAVLAGALLLSGCQVRPLYGVTATTFSVDGADQVQVKDQLAAISIKVSPIGDRSGLDRLDQLIRNELNYAFRRGGDAPQAAYKLEVLMDKQQTEVGVERLSDVPSAYNVTVSASFVLSDINTDRTLYQGRAFASASFDFSSQRFANLRAERDAEDRATKVVARDIHARLAGYFATNP
ncbi:hypothetical protein E1162_14565 [Rhodobacteraceae bacterium RKSG542]|uniref:LPS assembly lipoprotein LptE n=1 Tax=Pseudovibrio flavus TaxID=2529854 RepID=UPI0012BC5A5F|nr:LPS assembly lipoprotein LptE [Pseudovibrio flavus]MTI18464.1 hypothetical protein [Pseudovibrio flavus]